jgi:hypothetical protein
VEIINPYYPFYIKSGAALNVVCESSERTAINWIQQTPLTSWQDTQIYPGQDFSFQTCIEEPSGFTRSMLIRSNMSLSNRGMYLCKDSAGLSSYAVWVTVLYIQAQIVQHTTDLLSLSCSISGFDSNLPTMDYDWTFNDALIPHPHDSLVAAKVVHSSAELASNLKYNVTFNSGVLMLTVNNPVTTDGGTYNCSFTLGTNLGRLTFVESINVNGATFKSDSPPSFKAKKAALFLGSSVTVFSVIFMFQFIF